MIPQREKTCPRNGLGELLTCCLWYFGEYIAWTAIKCHINVCVMYINHLQMFVGWSGCEKQDVILCFVNIIAVFAGHISFFFYADYLS